MEKNYNCETVLNTWIALKFITLIFMPYTIATIYLLIMYVEFITIILFLLNLLIFSRGK